MTAFRPLSLAPFTRTTIYRSTTQLLNLVTAYRVTSTRHFHTPSLSRWLGRGRMRRTIGAWADSLGVTGHTDARSEEKDPREHEELFVMPGWAVVRYRESGQSDAPRPFDLYVSVSGFCSEARPPSKVSRTQRAIISVVKRFAALPNLPGVNPEDQLMGPIPTAVGMAFMEQADEDGKEQSKEPRPVSYQAYQSRRTRVADTGPPQLPPRPTSTRSSSLSSISEVAFTGREEIQTAHQNLNQRLAPFWSSVLPRRRVLFDVYASAPASDETPDEEKDRAAPSEEPLHSFEMYTDSNGHFTQIVTVPWEKLCTSPATVAEVFDGADTPLLGWQLQIRSRLDYEVLPVEESEMSYRARIKRVISTYGVDADDRDIGQGMEKVSLNTPGEPQVIEWTTVRVGRSGGVHVISDLDDTVKHSDILAGPREVFRNVFCRPLDDICVPETNAFYQRLDKRGVSGFHFVSNSPSQLFPSIRRFLTINAFPARHSIKLKYYGGRSIFSSLYDSPAERKRASLHELFRSFPIAQFILFGDSAEQDLELYVEFAKLFPDRVAVIAIRDVTSDRAAEMWREVEAMDGGSESSSSSIASRLRALADEPEEMPQDPPTGAIRPAPLRTNSASSTSTEEEMKSLSSAQQKILQRAVTWRSRMDDAQKAVSERTMVLFYKDVLEVEERITAVVDRLK